MPQTIKVEKIGWKKLQKILDGHVEAINLIAPIQGEGISLTQTKTGTIIAKRRQEDKNDQKQQQDGQGITGPCSLRLYDVSFMGANIVDPTTCVSTFVQVMIQDPGGWTDFDADIELPGDAHPATNPNTQ